MSRGVVLSTVMCLILACALIDAFAFAALLPVFFREWGLTNTEAGWIAGVYFGGYTVAPDGHEVSLERVDVFDPATETWSTAAPMPVPTPATRFFWAGLIVSTRSLKRRPRGRSSADDRCRRRRAWPWP